MYVFDLECDGLTPTKIHVLSVYNLETGKLTTTTDYDNMRKFFNMDTTMIGHNIVRFDIPIAERILDIKVTTRLVDTLALSWYLEFDRHRHGLDVWGDEFGITKPWVDDWEDLSIEAYEHRCEEDVKINVELWEFLYGKLNKLYDDDAGLWKLIDYLTFKMECASEQERSGWKLDVDLTATNLARLEKEKQDKVLTLTNAMPNVDVVSKKTRPKKPFKKDGTYSATGTAWFSLLTDKGLSNDYDGVVEVVTGSKPPNPNSNPQVKDWLYSFGWKPQTFKHIRNKKTDEVKQIPQISIENGGGACPSVKKLYKKEPALEVLDGLAILSHRIAILKGFLANVDEKGYVKAEIQGITNTMRFKHSVCVNLPGIDKPYGDVIRGCLVAPEGHELCGSDMASLEDRTKQHYMWKFDSAYVREMMTPDFDPHLDLAVVAGALTQAQADAHKRGDEDHGAVRKIYKAANYACVYGAGGPTVARAAGIPKKEGDKLVEAYWKRNWSVKAIPRTITTKVEFGSMWLLNPISEIWYSLRAEKDIFSTLNQGTGVWVFDTWIKIIKSKRPQMTAQFHDEVVLCIKKGSQEKCEQLLRWAISEVNKKLKLNRDMDVSVQFGDAYSHIH